MDTKKVIIAEKPNAAKKIANALAENDLSTKTSKFQVDYYEFQRNGDRHLVVPAAGHLFNLKQEGEGWEYPVFDAKWAPSYEVRDEAAFSEKYFKTIEVVATDGTDYIIACDFDVEGSLIGANILRFICQQEDARRMKFPTLTESDLVKAYENMSSSLDFNLIEAGETRHWLDWLYGVNITRALTLALNNSADLGFQVISAGRVQTPTLALLWEKEKEIQAFEPTPYWKIQIEASYQGKTLSAVHTQGKFWEEEKANEIVKKCEQNIPKITEIRKRKYQQKPPTPFNLTSLQSEAYRFFGYPPDKTLNIAENLYTKGFCSYPRTASQKLPAKINYQKILKALQKISKYKNLAVNLLKRDTLEPREGKKKDPAHVAIYPTHEPPKTKKLKEQQKKLYDLIVRRFLATFAKPALRETITILIDNAGETFSTKGRRTIKKNWHWFYGPYAKFEETHLPEVKEGVSLTLEEVTLLEKETKPPSRYTSASLVKLMETKGLGTRATRSNISRLLFNRGYLRGKSIEVTKLGEIVVKLLQEYCPQITSVKLTKQFKEKIDQIRNGATKKEKVIKEAKEVLSNILDVFKQKEEEIGQKLSESFKKAQKADSYIGKCPECGNELRIIHSKKTHKRFVGCTGYFKDVCDFSAPLPQKGKIQPIDTKCKYCGFPMVMVFRKDRRRPWFLCLNPECPSKTDG